MKKHIVIIGGGFAGINLANSLAKETNYTITLVDKNNYHFVIKKFDLILYDILYRF